ncbi:MAG: glycosyltransferase family 4 protein [Chitinophagaceae bacterium]|nr:glycosyltransferase family 4 protein [Chitinophagaceae bacterium]
MVSAYKKLISRFLCIGTEWFPRKGGLSTFNRQLAITLASCGYEVHCYLPDFTEEEALDAKEKNVSLIKAKQSKGQNDIERLSQKPTDLDFDVIIGHDIVTGPAMADLKMNYYKDSKVILFIHTAPGEIEWLKPEQEIESVAGKAETKENKQKELALNADWVAAVGPHLFFETQSLLSGATSNNNLIQFNPGLFKPIDQINFDFTTLTPEALLVGRIEDYTLKGVDIAVRSMHNVYTKWDIKTNGYLVKPKLIIRGLTVGTDDQLIKKLKEIESSNLRIQPKNYNAQTDVINEDIRKTALVLMPSRAEGFGLIALEALSNGRPILVSESSGFAMLLKRLTQKVQING